MDKPDRKLQLGRYDALLARHGDEELLSSFDALMREVGAKLQRRGRAPTPPPKRGPPPRAAPKTRQIKRARARRA
jgi:hypothetical protein